MKHAIYCGLVCAVIGFAVAAFLATASPASLPRWMSPIVARILCPPGIFSAITMTDPDTESIWLFFGPANALIYGAVGYTAWLFFMGDGDTKTSKKEDSDRPLGL
jgi:hypothetical protein